MKYRIDKVEYESLKELEPRQMDEGQGERKEVPEGMVQLGKVEEIILAYVVAHGFTSREDIAGKCSQTALKKISARSVPGTSRSSPEAGSFRGSGTATNPRTFRGSGLVRTGCDSVTRESHLKFERFSSALRQN